MFLSNLRNAALRGYLRGPDHPSKIRLVNWMGRHLFPTNGIPTKVSAGCRLYLHPRDYIEKLLLSGEGYEPITLEFLRKNLSEGDSAVLAGVNFGLHVIVAAQAVGASGNILGIEPQPAALLRADANLQLNGLSDRVSLVSIGLGAEEAFIEMAWSDINDNSGSASLLNQGRGFTIRLIRLETVIGKLAAKNPKLLLLDVEGYEINVLAGLTADTAPPILVIEVQRELMAKARVSEDQLLEKLRGFGYEFFTLHGKPVTRPGEAIPENNLIGLRLDAKVVWPAVPSP